jgi:hypothetical protein
MDLNFEQIQLLVVLVQTAEAVQEDQRSWTLVPSDGDTYLLEGTAGSQRVVASDVYALEHAKMLHCRKHNEIYGNEYEVTSHAFEFYAEWETTQAPPRRSA